MLELPQTAVFWGMLRRQGPWLSPVLPRAPGALARLGLLERIPLEPEGVSVDDMIRGIDIALDDRLPVLVLSLRGTADPETLSDWLRRVLAYLELRKVRPTTVAGIVQAVRR